ncbi:MAG: FGGY-family carbohydrate kinase, partial [Lachnospiraceae bacterium]|nr:FGGY-family carbohydrate kinase [Lachnospiraceae bacterium]
MADVKEMIMNGQTALGIEFGSTNIKAVLVDEEGTVLATGSYGWENSLVDGIWTYSQEEILAGLRGCYSAMRQDVEKKYGVTPATYGAMGISAMMHGYIALDKDGKLLAPFQTWRNSNTQQAADELTPLFDFNIPLRWTIAHLYQCILDQEEHLKVVDFVTTLDSYVHFLLTGEKVTGIGDASGIFPIDSAVNDYDQGMVDKFDELTAKYAYSWKLRDVLPKVMVAGENAGTLTEAGAKLLDETGTLKPGIPMAPPEGDAGTGMVATNSCAVRTGNVSAGTSTFAMLVCEKPLSKVYREIDMVTTPTGYPVAMSHANNGTSDLNAWVKLFGEFAQLAGFPMDPGRLYGLLYENSLKGDKDCGGLLSYGYYSGEGITHLNEGRPLFARQPDSNFNLANFMRAHLYSSLGAVKLGLDILLKDEQVKVDRIMGHGGLFKTKGVAQRYLAAAIHAPVSVLETAGEGGPWGMAILALFLNKKEEGESLEDFLDKKIFASMA